MQISDFLPDGLMSTRELAAKLVSRRKNAIRKERESERRGEPKRFYRHVSMKTRKKILLMMYGPSGRGPPQRSKYFIAKKLDLNWMIVSRVLQRYA